MSVSVSVVSDAEEAPPLDDEGVVIVRKSLQSAYYAGTVDVSILGVEESTYRLSGVARYTRPQDVLAVFDITPEISKGHHAKADGSA
jgi:hypothetical protein